MAGLFAEYEYILIMELARSDKVVLMLELITKCDLVYRIFKSDLTGYSILNI